MILVLEDEPAVRTFFQEALQRNGFQVAVAADADQALALSVEQGRAIDLLIADVRLPEGSGTDVAVKLRALNPEVPILFVSGTPVQFWDSEDSRNLAELSDGGFSFLQKPFTCWTLVREASALLARSQPAHNVCHPILLSETTSQAELQRRRY